MLVGGWGRDLLVGGSGADRIVGNADDDILVADELAWESMSVVVLHDALGAIAAEWTRTDKSYEERIENLDGDKNRGSDRRNGDYFLQLGSTIIEDDDRDKLTGSAGLDWFFYDLELDLATDLHDEVFADDLDWILR